MMSNLMVEGFDILVSRGESCILITIPGLPGVVGQVDDPSKVKSETRRILGAHLLHLASKKR